MMEVMRIMQNQVRKKETEVQLLKDKQKELEFMNAMLSDRLALTQRRRFGSSSEKYADGYEQMDLFNEAEVNADTDAAEIEEEIVIPSHKRKKRTGKKEEDLSNFEVTETIEYKRTGEDRQCPDCGTKYKVVTKEVVKRLKFIPSTFEVVEEVTYVYSCPKCGAMIRPEKELPLIKGSIATPSLVAGIMNAKYVNGMPLARQEREFARYDLNLSTKTMTNWIISCADRYLGLLYGQMREEFLKSRYIHCDETRIQVIDEPDQKGSSQNWMWVYLTDRYSEAPQMVLFDYERTRAGYHPVNFLGDTFHGYLTCDGYQAYHGLNDSITVTGCFTHARRRFDAALTALKKDFTKEQLKETAKELRKTHWNMQKNAGIDAGNYQQARELILEQLQAMQSGDFTAQEIEQTKTMLKNSYFMSLDSSSNLIEQAFIHEVLPELYVDEATFLKALEAVSKEDIMRLAQSLKLQAQYFMKGEVYAEEEI